MTAIRDSLRQTPRSGLRERCRRTIVPRRAQPGLTLVELLAVVVILGIIAATLTLSFRGQVGTAKRQLAKTGIAVVVNAIETFYLETGRIPTMDEGLQVLTQPTPGRSEPFLKPDKLLDPWRTPYVYITPGPKSTYVVISYGADKQLGGAPGTESADITSDDLGEDPSGGHGGGSSGAPASPTGGGGAG